MKTYDECASFEEVRRNYDLMCKSNKLLDQETERLGKEVRMFLHEWETLESWVDGKSDMVYWKMKEMEENRPDGT